MIITARRLIGTPVEAGECIVGKIDDVFFDVRTGDITHVSVALTGWYRGTIVLIPWDPCQTGYVGRKIIFYHMSAADVRQAPLLDEEAARNAEVAQLLAAYQDTAPCWTFGARCCVSSTRSEAIEKKTDQPAIWGTRDLRKAVVSNNHDVESGRVLDLLVDVEDWRVTHAIAREGPWYQNRRVMIPTANFAEVEKTDSVTRVRLRPPVSTLAA